MYLLEANPNYGLLIPVIIITVPVIILAVIVFIKIIIKQAKLNKNGNVKFEYDTYFGGKDNILNIEVVLSRVNVTVKDLDKVQLEELKNQNIGVLISGNVIKCSNQDFADKVNKSLK